MGKAAATKRPTVKNGDPTEAYLAALEAKQRFVSSALNMGWRLLLTFLIPVAIGAWADRRFDSAPSYVLTGIFIAVAASIYVIRDTVKEVNAETAELDKETKKPNKRKKNV